MVSPLLSEITFGSLLLSSPRATSETSRRSRIVRTQVKNASPALLRRAIEVLHEEFSRSALATVLGPDVVLVPAPRSALRVEGALWPALEIANALCEAGFGREVRPLLSRIEALTESAFQLGSERPSPLRQYETLAYAPELLVGRIALVDDVVTRGTMLLAAASRIAETNINVEVKSFALLRTQSEGDVERIVSPTLGTIHRRESGDTHREP